MSAPRKPKSPPETNPSATSEIYRFTTTIEAGRGGGALVRFPYDVPSEFGSRGQVRIEAAFDGHPYRGSLVPMGGDCHILGVRKDVRKAIGKEVGDSVEVILKRDLQPRVIIIPSELEEALARRPELRRHFDSLSYTRRKEFAASISDAKRPETKVRRLDKILDELSRNL